LNGDGETDETLDFGYLVCSSSASYWIGSGRSNKALVVKDQVTIFLAQDLAITYPFGNFPVITMEVHGNICGEVGFVDCVVSTVWSEGEFQAPK
jgi:hypothetical protein